MHFKPLFSNRNYEHLFNIDRVRRNGNITSYEYRNDNMFLRNQFKGVGMFNLSLVKKQEIELKMQALSVMIKLIRAMIMKKAVLSPYQLWA